jgi:putative component of membrane protein insertase Oxa1/YidC/SpoIIIJ protein YidD
MKFFLIFIFPIFTHAQNVFVQDTLLLIRDVKIIDTRKSGLHTFYKKYLSSQDGTVCTFHPDCSDYAKEAINTRGLILGIFLTSDRLIRCNGNHHEYYYYNYEVGRPIDLPAKPR